jgi:hypothetical protein
MAESDFSSCLVCLAATAEESKQKIDNLVEDIDGILYIIASIGFIIGSIFFLPNVEAIYPSYNIGEYLFIVSSVLLSWISINDFVEVYKVATKSKEQAAVEAAAFFNSNNDGVGTGAEMDGTTISAERNPSFNHFNDKSSQKLEFIASILYSIGCIFFIVGSVLFLYYPNTGGWTFVIGSAVFVFGSFVNSLQIWDSPDSKSAQMANTVSMLYTIGSTMFFCASFPYTYTFNDETDKNDSTSAAAWMYIFGSVLFLLCGILDIRRFHYIRNSIFFHVVNNDDDDDHHHHNNNNNNKKNRNRNRNNNKSISETVEPSSRSSFLSEIMPKDQIVNKTEQAAA